MVRSAAGTDDNAGDDDDSDPKELDHGHDDLDLTKDLNGADVDQEDEDEEDTQPRSDRDPVRPILQHGDDSLELVGDGDGTGEPVGPADGEGRGDVEELARPLGESRGQRVEDGHLADCLVDGPCHAGGDPVADEDGGGTPVLERGSGAEPETHPDGGTDGEHDQMPGIEVLLEPGLVERGIGGIMGGLVDDLPGRRDLGRPGFFVLLLLEGHDDG